MWSVPNAYIKLPSQLTTYLCPLSLMLVCVESTAVAVIINANDPRSAMCSPALTSLSTTNHLCTYRLLATNLQFTAFRTQKAAAAFISCTGQATMTSFTQTIREELVVASVGPRKV